MKNRRLAWHYDAFTVPLDALRSAARASDLTLNDAFLGGISGGLLRYHERQGFAVDELRLTMPISIRTADDPIGGNRVTLMRFKVPTGLHDPVERMRRIHRLCLSVRHEAAIPYTNTIAAALNVLPRGVVGGMLKHVDFLASNVPGIDVAVYLAGAHVAEWYAFGPTIGSALNATLVSYDGSCFVGVNVDTGAIPDGDLMLACLRESFSEIVALGGSNDEMRRNAAARPGSVRSNHRGNNEIGVEVRARPRDGAGRLIGDGASTGNRRPRCFGMGGLVRPSNLARGPLRARSPKPDR